MDDLLDNLKVKPLPKKNEKVDFFIEKKEEMQLPTIIDKTAEKLINAQKFISSIQNQLGIYDKDKVYKIEIDKTVETTDKSSIKPKSKDKLDRPDTFTNIVKTTELIKLLPFGVAKTTKPKTKTDLPATETFNKTEYKKKSKLISDYEEDGEEVIGDTKIADRLPKSTPNILIQAPDYIYIIEKYLLTILINYSYHIKKNFY